MPLYCFSAHFPLILSKKHSTKLLSFKGAVNECHCQKHGSYKIIYSVALQKSLGPYEYSKVGTHLDFNSKQYKKHDLLEMSEEPLQDFKSFGALQNSHNPKLRQLHHCLYSTQAEGELSQTALLESNLFYNLKWNELKKESSS